MSKTIEPKHTPTIDLLATAYTKALCQNPRDTIHANIERALNGCPVIVRAVNAHDERAAIQKAHDAFAADVAATLRLDWSGPEKLRSIQKLVERLDSDIIESKAARAAIAKAEGVKP